MHETLNLDEHLYGQWRQWEELHQRAIKFQAKVKHHLMAAGQAELVLELGFLVETIHTNLKDSRAEYDAF